jgi:tRNA-Thr(GGU) m(6)t(6)A37 methyltransferase TsaA
MEIRFRPIGVVHSPFKAREDIPRYRCFEPQGYNDVQGELEIFKEFEGGLQDIDGFTHIILLFAFHKSEIRALTAHPPYDGRKRGVFSTRSPHRPNPLGATVLKLIRREGNVLKVLGVDMIEGTPILDIKPYTPRDLKKDAEFGWMEKFTPDPT